MAYFVTLIGASVVLVSPNLSLRILERQSLGDSAPETLY